MATLRSTDSDMGARTQFTGPARMDSKCARLPSHGQIRWESQERALRLMLLVAVGTNMLNLGSALPCVPGCGWCRFL